MREMTPEEIAQSLEEGNATVIVQRKGNGPKTISDEEFQRRGELAAKKFREGKVEVRKDGTVGVKLTEEDLEFIGITSPDREPTKEGEQERA